MWYFISIFVLRDNILYTDRVVILQLFVHDSVTTISNDETFFGGKTVKKYFLGIAHVISYVADTNLQSHYNVLHVLHDILISVRACLMM